MVLAMVPGMEDGDDKAVCFDPRSLRRIIDELCHEVRLGFGRCIFCCTPRSAAPRAFGVVFGGTLEMASTRVLCILFVLPGSRRSHIVRRLFVRSSLHDGALAFCRFFSFDRLSSFRAFGRNQSCSRRRCVSHDTLTLWFDLPSHPPTPKPRIMAWTMKLSGSWSWLRARRPLRSSASSGARGTCRGSFTSGGA